MNPFLQGLTIGIAYVAPIGMQNLFVINSALTQKRSRAYLTATIVILCDILLALVCFFGIGALMSLYPSLELAVLFVGSILLLYIGYSLLRARKKNLNQPALNVPLSKVAVTAFIVTWLNPQAIIDGTIMLGAFSASLPAGESSKFLLGVTTASCLWFLGLTTIITLMSRKFTDKALTIVNKVCGAVILFYALKLLYTFFIKIRI